MRSAASRTGPSAAPSVGRAEVVRAADLVAGLVAETVLLAGPRLDRRQRDPVDQRDRQLAALVVALEQDPVVVGERGDQRLGHLLRPGREPDPERGAAGRRLDHEREAEVGLDLLEGVGRAQLAEGHAR